MNYNTLKMNYAETMMIEAAICNRINNEMANLDNLLVYERHNKLYYIDCMNQVLDSIRQSESGFILIVNHIWLSEIVIPALEDEYFNISDRYSNPFIRDETTDIGLELLIMKRLIKRVRDMYRTLIQ